MRPYKEDEQVQKLLKEHGFVDDKKNADQESAEDFKDMELKTEYPKPIKRYRLIWEAFNVSIEEVYFWHLNFLRQDWGYAWVDKTADSFSSSENSSFFGQTQQRLGLQQDKVSQFLATIGKMVKELFQLVRELRILDERIGYYDDSYSKDPKRREGAEISLKGVYVDMVEGGAKNPSSVFGMARELQFATLPDLFFAIHPETLDDIVPKVDALKFNRKVKEILKRKFYSYLQWKDQTFKEMKARRTFTVKYLRQHYDIIKMYMEWVRPYMRNIKRLHMDMERTTTPDLIAAFEGAMMEIEFIAYKLPLNPKTGSQNHKYHSCIVANFLYRTRPSLGFQQEGYQRGPVHVGRVDVVLRCYSWTKEQIENYKKMKRAQDMMLLQDVSESVKAAYDALGDDLQKYIEEAEGKKKSDHHQASGHGDDHHGDSHKKGGFLSTFFDFGGHKDAHGGGHGDDHGHHLGPVQLEAEKKLAKQEVLFNSWEAYKNFKKAHRMLAW